MALKQGMLPSAPNVNKNKADQMENEMINEVIKIPKEKQKIIYEAKKKDQECLRLSNKGLTAT